MGEKITAEDFLKEGILYLESRQFDNAIEYFNKAIEIKPDYLRSYTLRGAAYQVKGEHDNAIMNYDKAIELKPDYADAYYARGVAYSHKGEHNNAIMNYDKVIELKPDFADAYYAKGVEYGFLGKYDYGIMNFDKAIELKPDFADAYYNRGIVYSDIGEYENALNNFDKAIELKPDNAEAYFKRGALYGYKEEIDNALMNFDKAIELKSDDAEAYFWRGTIFKNKEEYDNSLRNYGKAIELRPHYTEAYYNRGIVYGHKEEYDNALCNFDKAIELNPDYTDAYYNRGVIFSNKGEYDDAIKNYNKAIELNPDYADAYYNKGVRLSDKGEYEDAIKNYNKVIELRPDFAVAYLSRGVSYDGKGEYDNAITNYNKAIELNPDYAEAYSNRGGTYSHKGENDNAIMNFDKAIELKPDFAEAYFNRGAVYYDKEEYESAMVNYDRAIEIKPVFPNPYYSKAVLLLKKDESFLAFTYLLKYYFLEPRYEFLNNCFTYVEKFKKNELHAPLFLYRVFEENQFLLTAFSFEHFYEEIYEDSSEKLILIKSINKQDPTWDDEFIDNYITISIDEISGFKIKGLLYYYYGDPIYAKKMFDEIDTLDETDMMGQYYLLMSLLQYLEDYSGELESALIQCLQLLDKNEKDKVQLYYAGQIYILNNDPDLALKCFTKSNDFLPSRFMQVVIHNRLENKIQLEKCIKSIFESTGDDELEALKLLLNGNIIETDLEDENWVNSLLFNAHVNEISDARNIIFDWLDDEQNKKFYPQYWEQGLIFDYTTDAERKAYKVWKATEETSRKLNDLSESLKLKYFTKLESKVKEQFPDIFDLLDSLDGNRLESIIANKIQELKITDTEKEKYSILIAYSFLKDRLSIHQNIFLNSFLVVKFHFDNQKEWQIGGRLFEAAIMVSFATPLSEFIGHTIGVHHILPHIFFHTVGQTFYQKTVHFLKTKVLDKLRKKRDTSESLSYNEFKKMYIEYVSELKEEEVDLFEKWDIDGLEEWFEENK